MCRLDDLLVSMRESGTTFWMSGGNLYCRSYKGALTSDRIAAIRGLRDQIISYLKVTPIGAESTLTNRSNRIDIAPLTFQQHWGLSWYQTETYSDFVVAAVLLRGSVRKEVLAESLDRLVLRHEALRTRIVFLGGVAAQAIDEPSGCALEILDYRSVPREEGYSHTREYLQRFFNQRVDLETGPLFQAKLVCLGHDEYVLAIAVHHISCDAISQALLFREIWIIYADSIQGRPQSLRNVPLQYADYARWQRQHWQNKAGPYWARRLNGAIGVHLPRDDDLSTIEPFSPAKISVSFDESLSSAIRELAQREHTVPGVVLIALYAALMSRWSHKTDLVISLVDAGRIRSEHVSLMGTFSHPLPLRVELRDDDTFVELLERVVQEYLNSQEHSDFGKLASEFPNLFTTWFMWLSWQTSDSTGLEPTAMLSQSDWDSLALNFTVQPFVVRRVQPEGFKLRAEFGMGLWDTPTGISGGIGYRADLFKEASICRFSEDLLRLSECLVRDPWTRIGSVRV